MRYPSSSSEAGKGGDSPFLCLLFYGGPPWIERGPPALRRQYALVSPPTHIPTSSKMPPNTLRNKVLSGLSGAVKLTHKINHHRGMVRLEVTDWAMGLTQFIDTADMSGFFFFFSI